MHSEASPALVNGPSVRSNTGISIRTQLRPVLRITSNMRLHLFLMMTQGPEATIEHGPCHRLIWRHAPTLSLAWHFHHSSRLQSRRIHTTRSGTITRGRSIAHADSFKQMAQATLLMSCIWYEAPSSWNSSHNFIWVSFVVIKFKKTKRIRKRYKAQQREVTKMTESLFPL